MKADVVIITALRKELDAILHHGEEKYGLGWTSTNSHRSIRTYHTTVNNAQTKVSLLVKGWHK
jgi:hypothetical protein